MRRLALIPHGQMSCFRDLWQTDALDKERDEGAGEIIHARS